MMRIAVDAMGGDRAPAVTVDGAVAAAGRFGCEVVLVGDRETLERELARHRLRRGKVEIEHAPGVVAMDERPAVALRRKPDSSIAVAARLLGEGRVDALVSAGSTGATVVASILYVSLLAGVERPGIATLLPSLREPTVVLDAGATVDCRPENLYQFAVMGSAFASRVLGRRSPRVGLLSVGTEPTKGNTLTRRAYELLSGAADIHFVGNVEGRDIFTGDVDVVVCDGFVGNVVLKTSEGLAESLEATLRKEILSRPLARAGVVLALPALRAFRRHVDYAERGGAVLLGVDGVVVIAHGGSNAKAICNAIGVAFSSVESRLNERIADQLSARAAAQSQGAGAAVGGAQGGNGAQVQWTEERGEVA